MPNNWSVFKSPSGYWAAVRSTSYDEAAHTRLCPTWAQAFAYAFEGATFDRSEVTA